jgi:hypothetical protein
MESENTSLIDWINTQPLTNIFCQTKLNAVQG